MPISPCPTKMQHSLQSRFQGAFLGAALGEILGLHGTSQSTSPVANAPTGVRWMGF